MDLTSLKQTYLRKNNENTDRTDVNGANAIAWMMTIYKLMSVRRKSKIKEIINKWKQR